MVEWSGVAVGDNRTEQAVIENPWLTLTVYRRASSNLWFWVVCGDDESRGTASTKEAAKSAAIAAARKELERIRDEAVEALKELGDG